MRPYSLGQLGKAAIVALCAAAFAVAAGKPARAACPTERARYTMVHDHNFTAGFWPIAKLPDRRSDVAFYVRSRRTGTTLWYLVETNAPSRLTVVETSDVRAKDWRPSSADDHGRGSDALNDFLVADKSHDFVTEAPAQSSTPPAFVLLPGLPDRFWYGEGHWEGVRLDFFQFSRCAAPGDEVAR